MISLQDKNLWVNFDAKRGASYQVWEYRASCCDSESDNECLTTDTAADTKTGYLQKPDTWVDTLCLWSWLLGVPSIIW